MADGKVTVQIDVKDASAVNGAKRVKSSIDDIKKADAGLGWSGLEKGAAAAEKSNGMIGAVSVALGNLAAQGMTMVLSKAQDIARQVVEIGSGFETSMSKVSALSGATGDELGRLESKARELGASTTFSASQAADALGYMALAGWDTQQMLQGVDSVLTLAQAGEMDLAAASDLVTDYLSAFNMEASETQRMVDVLAFSQANANTTVEGLGMAYKNCAANCNAFGMDVETTSAALAMMANQGLKGQESGTALNAVMRDMTARMKDGAIAIGENTVQVMDAQGNYRDFMDIIADVEAATAGMGDAEKAAALQSTFTADSIKGLNLLLNAGAGQAASFRDELYGCAGTAQATADTMTNNLGGDVAAMGSAFEELAIKVYQGLQEPLREAVQFVTGTVVPGLEFLFQNLDKIAPALVGIGTGIAVVANKQRIAEDGKRIWAALTAETAKNAAATKLASGTTGTYGMKVKAVSAEQKAFATATKASTVGITAQAGAVKASTVAMNLGTMATRAMSTALKTIAPIAAMTALVEVVMLVGGALETSSRNAENLEKATDGMSDAINAGQQAFDDYVPAADAAADATENVAMSADDCIASQAELAEKTRETFADAGTSAAVAQSYADTIAELGDRGKLTADEQARLQAAVEGFNEATGESIGITDLQNGKLTVAKDKILEMAAAYKEEAMAEAAREMYKEHAKQLIEDQLALKEATDKLTAAQQEYNEKGLDPSLGYMDPYADAVALAQQEVDRLTEAQNAEKAAMEDLNGIMATNVGSFGTLDEALASCGLSMESFGSISDAQMAALQSGFDGGLASIVNTCATQGVAIPSALANAIMANSGLPQGEQRAMLDAMVLQMTGGDVAAAAQVLGHDIDQGLVDGITGSAEMPAGAVGVMSEEVIARAKDAFDSHSPSLVMTQLGNDINAGLANGISGSQEGPAAAMGAVGAAAIGAISGLPGQIGGTGYAAASNLASGLQSGTGAASGAAASVATSALKGVEGTKDTFTKAGQTAADGFGNTIGGADAYNQAHALAVTAERGLQQNTATARKIGQDFAQGYGQGISSKESWVYQKAYDLAQAAVRAVKAAQDSASPSKVARSLGVDYGTGYALGMSDEYKHVEKLAAGLPASATKGVAAKAAPVLALNYRAAAQGRFAPVAQPAQAAVQQAQAGAAVTQSTELLAVMKAILAELCALHKGLPRMLSDACRSGDPLTMRELASLNELAKEYL